MSDRSESAPGARRSLLRRFAPVLLILAIVEVAVVGSIYLFEQVKLKREMFTAYFVEGAYSDRYEYVAKGVQQPPAHSAGQAHLSDSEGVVGVVVGGKARAYRLAAMRGREEHIVNDVLAGQPVSVTYCDVNECVRVFSEPERKGLLDIAQGGLKADRMVLRIGGVDYFQDTGEPIKPGASAAPIPYASLPAKRTTWRAWKTEHPDTDVFEGLPGSLGP